MPRRDRPPDMTAPSVLDRPLSAPDLRRLRNADGRVKVRVGVELLAILEATAQRAAAGAEHADEGLLDLLSRKVIGREEGLVDMDWQFVGTAGSDALVFEVSGVIEDDLLAALAPGESAQPSPASADDVIPGFFHLARSWYAGHCHERTDFIDEVLFGLYVADGSGTGRYEAVVRWYALGRTGRERPVPRLEVFGDAFQVLADFPEVFAELPAWNSRVMQPGDFCDLLRRHGFADLTKETRER